MTVLAQGLGFVDPGAEVFAAEFGEGKEKIAEVALRVDEDGGDAIQGGFLEQGEAEAGLAAARHADTDGMGGEILGVVEDEVGPEVRAERSYC